MGPHLRQSPLSEHPLRHHLPAETGRRLTTLRGFETAALQHYGGNHRLRVQQVSVAGKLRDAGLKN